MLADEWAGLTEKLQRKFGPDMMTANTHVIFGEFTNGTGLKPSQEQRLTRN